MEISTAEENIIADDEMIAKSVEEKREWLENAFKIEEKREWLENAFKSKHSPARKKKSQKNQEIVGRRRKWRTEAKKWVQEEVSVTLKKETKEEAFKELQKILSSGQSKNLEISQKAEERSEAIRKHRISQNEDVKTEDPRDQRTPESPGEFESPFSFETDVVFTADVTEVDEEEEVDIKELISKNEKETTMVPPNIEMVEAPEVHDSEINKHVDMEHKDGETQTKAVINHDEVVCNNKLRASDQDQNEDLPEGNDSGATKSTKTNGLTPSLNICGNNVVRDEVVSENIDFTRKESPLKKLASSSTEMIDVNDDTDKFIERNTDGGKGGDEANIQKVSEEQFSEDKCDIALKLQDNGEMENPFEGKGTQEEKPKVIFEDPLAFEETMAPVEQYYFMQMALHSSQKPEISKDANGREEDTDEATDEATIVSDNSPLYEKNDILKYEVADPVETTSKIPSDGNATESNACLEQELYEPHTAESSEDVEEIGVDLVLSAEKKANFSTSVAKEYVLESRPCVDNTPEHSFKENSIMREKNEKSSSDEENSSISNLAATNTNVEKNSNGTTQPTEFSQKQKRQVKTEDTSTANLVVANDTSQEIEEYHSNDEAEHNACTSEKNACGTEVTKRMEYPPNLEDIEGELIAPADLGEEAAAQSTTEQMGADNGIIATNDREGEAQDDNCPGEMHEEEVFSMEEKYKEDEYSIVRGCAPRKETVDVIQKISRQNGDTETIKQHSIVEVGPALREHSFKSGTTTEEAKSDELNQSFENCSEFTECISKEPKVSISDQKIVVKEIDNQNPHHSENENGLLQKDTHQRSESDGTFKSDRESSCDISLVYVTRVECSESNPKSSENDSRKYCNEATNNIEGDGKPGESSLVVEQPLKSIEGESNPVEQEDKQNNTNKGEGCNHIVSEVRELSVTDFETEKAVTEDSAITPKPIPTKETKPEYRIEEEIPDVILAKGRKSPSMSSIAKMSYSRDKSCPATEQNDTNEKGDSENGVDAGEPAVAAKKNTEESDSTSKSLHSKEAVSGFLFKVKISEATISEGSQSASKFKIAKTRIGHKTQETQSMLENSRESETQSSAAMLDALSKSEEPSMQAEGNVSANERKGSDYKKGTSDDSFGKRTAENKAKIQMIESTLKRSVEFSGKSPAAVEYAQVSAERFQKVKEELLSLDEATMDQIPADVKLKLASTKSLIEGFKAELAADTSHESIDDTSNNAPTDDNMGLGISQSTSTDKATEPVQVQCLESCAIM